MCLRLLINAHLCIHACVFLYAYISMCVYECTARYNSTIFNLTFNHKPIIGAFEGIQHRALMTCLIDCIVVDAFSVLPPSPAPPFFLLPLSLFSIYFNLSGMQHFLPSPHRSVLSAVPQFKFSGIHLPAS